MKTNESKQSWLALGAERLRLIRRAVSNVSLAEYQILHAHILTEERNSTGGRPKNITRGECCEGR